MVLILYIVNLLAAIPLAMAWRSVLQSGFGASMDSSELMDGLDFSVLQDFMKFHGDELSAVTRQISWVMIVYMLVNTFLAGGILSAIQESRKKFSGSAFFAGCGTYFFRFFRLFLIFGVLLFIIAAILSALLAILSAALTENSTSEITVFVITVVLAVLSVLPLMVILTIADYAKISVVVNDERSMFRTAWRSMKFVFRYFFKTFGLEVLMVLVPIVLFGLYLWLDYSIGMTTSLTILVMLIIQQLFMASRAWTKVFFFAGEMSLYQGLRPVGSPVAYSPVNESGAVAARV